MTLFALGLLSRSHRPPSLWRTNGTQRGALQFPLELAFSPTRLRLGPHPIRRRSQFIERRSVGRRPIERKTETKRVRDEVASKLRKHQRKIRTTACAGLAEPTAVTFSSLYTSYSTDLHTDIRSLIITVHRGEASIPRFFFFVPSSLLFACLFFFPFFIVKSPTTGLDVGRTRVRNVRGALNVGKRANVIETRISRSMAITLTDTRRSCDRGVG